MSFGRSVKLSALTPLLCLFALTCLAAAQIRYAEPSSCAVCHSEIAKRYSRSPMARSFGVVGQDDLPYLDGGQFHHEPSDEFFAISARSGGAYLTRYQAASDGTRANVLERTRSARE